MTQKKTPQSVWIAAVVMGLLLVAVVGYFVLVSPQRGKAADLKKEIDSTQKQIDDARALVAKQKNAQKVKVADVFKLTKAMPDSPDEAGVLLDLNDIAQRSGITFDSLNVQASTALSSYQVIPLQLEFHGNFYDLSDFLYRLRNLVNVRRGALDARGRLFAVDQIALDEGVYKFPLIRAQIRIDAFVYGTGSAAAVAPPQTSAAPSARSSGTKAGTAPTTTTPAASTTPTTTTPSSGSASAAGATP